VQNIFEKKYRDIGIGTSGIVINRMVANHIFLNKMKSIILPVSEVLSVILKASRDNVIRTLPFRMK
jgi:hypothetical protein